MATELTDEWLTILDDATRILAQLRSGSMSAALLTNTIVLSKRFTTWCTASRDAIDQLALTSLATAYQFRRTFDRRSNAVLQLITEIDQHVSKSL
jgi:hypothetical protein